jgi:hypothetical protein
LIVSARRASSVMPLSPCELRTMLVATPRGARGEPHRAFCLRKLVPRALRKAAYRKFRGPISGSPPYPSHLPSSSSGRVTLSRLSALALRDARSQRFRKNWVPGHFA